MFLRELELTNFKCHGELYLDFETLEKARQPIRKTTFLLGENGTGKSALLKAIALVTAGSNSIGDLLSGSDEWIRTGKPFCEIRATLLTSENVERNIKLRIERGAQLKNIIDQNAESLELVDRAIAHADRNYFVVAYGASRRLNRSNQFGESTSSIHPRTANIHSLFNPDAPLVSLANWAMELDYTGKGDGIQTVKKALDAFLMENVKFKRIDRENKQLIFSTVDGELPLSQLSDGYQNVASWVGDLMYRINDTFRDFKEPLKARGLLLIDEIDLHLHPRWQRRLHSFLQTKLPNLQVIATTHSPLTAQQADENELYALRRDKKEVELIPFRGAPNKMLLHQILMSPVFGLETDESLEVEEAKSQVRNASLKKKKTPGDRKTIAGASKQLGDSAINIRSNSLLSENDLTLLQNINQELKSKK